MDETETKADLSAESMTDEQIVADMADRFEEFRAGMTALIQKTGIFPDVGLDENTKRIGITLNDNRFFRPDLNEEGRKLALKRYQDLKDATPLPDPTPEEAAALDEMLAKETEDETPTTESSTA